MKNNCEWYTVKTKMMNICYDFKDLAQYLDLLKLKMNIAIVYGGNHQKKEAVIYQTPHIRPWKSYEKVARDIQQSLQNIGYEHVVIMPDDIGTLNDS